MPLIDRFFYRPEIDGLRAIAVLAVLFFHFELGAPGGYVGVDVFFVISGFLISSLIWKDLESGRFTFALFWERRIRRILPALVVVTIATLLAGFFLLFPADLENLAQAALSQLGLAANVHYWRDSGYFTAAADKKPLLHTWSLAVEEQFYLVFPLLLWAAFQRPALRRRGAILALVGLALLASFALSVVALPRYSSATFYLLPTRAWELLLGALVAFLPAPAAPLTQRWRHEALAWAALALIVLPIFWYDSRTLFPGAAALPPCLGSALLIWINGRVAGSKPPTVVGALLAVRPLIVVGLASYSLYLWHWPFIAFAKYLALGPLSLASRLTLLVLALLCTLLSWRAVELPFRERRIGANRRSLYGMAGGAATAILLIGALALATDGLPGRFPPRALAAAAARFDKGFIRNLTTAQVAQGQLVGIGTPDPTIAPSLLVWGDSHAMAALPAVDALLAEKGLAGRAATRSSTAPVLGWFFRSKYGMNEAALPFNEAVFTYVQEQQIPLVILTGYWSAYTTGDPSDTLDAALLHTVQRLQAIGVQSVVLLDVPHHDFDVPIALARAAVAPLDLARHAARPIPESQWDGLDPAILAQIEASGGLVLDPKAAFLDPTQGHFRVELNGVTLYRDEQHLTTAGATLILLPLLRERLAQALP